MRPTICEIIYKMQDGQPVDAACEVVRPECIAWSDDGPLLLGEKVIKLRPLIEQTPPKFVQVPFGEMRKTNELPEHLRRMALRDVCVSACLRFWRRGDCSLLEALRAAAWSVWDSIAQISEKHPGLQPKPLKWDLKDDMETWIERVVEAAVIRHDEIATLTKFVAEHGMSTKFKVDAATIVKLGIAQLQSEGTKRIAVALGTKSWNEIRERAAALGMTRREDEMLGVSIVVHRPELDGNEWSDISLQDMDKCANSTN